MNREIKFRCWDKESKLMTNEPHLDVQYGNLTSGYDCEIIMQFTGLKDRTGADIYEGDILSGYRKGSNSDIKYTGFIKWQTEQAGWIIECGKYVMEILSLAMSGDGINTNLDTFEVIGNIYQNPELLETVKK